MSYVYTEAIVLAKRTLWEADRLYIIFSPEYGKIEAQVKSAASTASKLAGSLEPVSHIETMIINGQKRETIGGAQLLKRYNIFEWQTVAQTAIVREIFLRMVHPGVKEPLLYQKLKAYFEAVSGDLPANTRAFYTLRFIWQALKILGHVDFIKNQPQSREPLQLLFDKSGQRLKKNLNNCLAEAAEAGEVLSKEELSELKNLTLTSLRYFFESDLKSAPFGKTV